MSDTATLFSEQDLENLNKESPTPLYFQLYSLLKARILDGTLPYGRRMPTEEQLASTFGVSRITAKRAMDELAGEELVERRRGKGTHITYRYTPRPVQAPLTGMLQEIESMARNSNARILECKMLQPPQHIREELELEAGETALHLVRVREREGRRFGYYVSWTAGVKMPRNRRIFERTPRLTYFRDNGLEVSHVTQTLSAEAASPEVAKALDVPLGSPLLSLVRRSYNKVGDREHLRDHLRVLYNPEHFQYKMDLKID
jgi:GntR family transcriptional regulator